MKERPVEALVRGNNADLIREVARLYAPDPSVSIADVTFGRGTFWKRTPHLNVTGSDLHTVPARPYDFRDLPYADNSFDIVVFDPPYIAWPGNHMSDERYRNAETTKGFSPNDIRELYRAGLRECQRVARRQLWVKCKDGVSGPKQCWLHVHILQDAEGMGLVGRDLFILDATSRIPHGNWKTQKHARKPMSYLWVFDVRPNVQIL
ncbi:class I SAM-dependent methyltransferase [Yoonia litorea]|uniref:DNA methylase n=1 Tax=Yoonia litorea TaxID=1123755 RepID=A0A1I6MWJ6_9RHOB|nr:class I SAM-dependent methyltransferase [Yoonia litorea]SFS20083.1 hypothetical protein SAMN05444714_2472 [Yoonia litorea]